VSWIDPGFVVFSFRNGSTEGSQPDFCLAISPNLPVSFIHFLTILTKSFLDIPCFRLIFFMQIEGNRNFLVLFTAGYTAM